MKWSWIDLNFPWIGFAAAILVLFLLFLTDRLRGDVQKSRWRDLTWLSWLAVAMYLLHNVEEYGVDLRGQAHAFPASMCASLGQAPYPVCAIPPGFYLAVNLPLFWVGAPVAALMSRRHPLVGLVFYGVIFVNAVAHVGAFLHAGYNPGVLTAFLLFLPVSIWVALVCFGKAGLPYRALAFIVAEGIVLHAILIGSTKLFLNGTFGPSTLISIQIMNAILLFLLAWSAEKWKGGRLWRTPFPGQSS